MIKKNELSDMVYRLPFFSLHICVLQYSGLMESHVRRFTSRFTCFSFIHTPLKTIYMYHTL